MSSQAGFEVPFSVSPAQQSFRLLELPPELVHLLSSASAPTYCPAHPFAPLRPVLIRGRLCLKSSDPQPSSSAEAVLCTPDKTYQVREVQTSNSVLVSCPTTGGASQASGIAEPGLSAISKCGSTLELLPSKEVSAKPFLIKALPLYTGLEGDEFLTTQAAKRRDRVFADIPLSVGECEHGWIDTVAFEAGSPARSFRPAASIALKAWATMLLVANEQGIDLTGMLVPSYLGTLFSSAEDWPVELTKAVVKRLVAPEDALRLHATYVDEDTATMDVALDRSRTIQWTGLVLLETLWREQGPVPMTEFVAKWKDSLPEAWRDDVAVDRLEV